VHCIASRLVCCIQVRVPNSCIPGAILGFSSETSFRSPRYYLKTRHEFGMTGSRNICVCVFAGPTQPAAPHTQQQQQQQQQQAYSSHPQQQYVQQQHYQGGYGGGGAGRASHSAPPQQSGVGVGAGVGEG